MSISSASASDLRINLQLVGMGSMIVILTAITPMLHQKFGGWAILSVVFVTSGVTIRALGLTLCQETRNVLWIVLSIALALRVSLLFSDPRLSTDIFRYIWDGRVQAAGINPYRYIPQAEELASLRDPAIFPNINRAGYAVTIYPPAAQVFFFIITRFGESVVVMKAGMVCFEAVTIVSLMGILRILGLPVASVVAYAWHPLPVWEIAGNGHVDSAMISFMMLGLWMFLKHKPLEAGVLTTIGAIVKPTALLALPVIWRPWNWKLPLLVIATTILLYLPYHSVGWGALGFLPDYAREEGIASGHGFWALTRLQMIFGEFSWMPKLYLSASFLLLGGMALRVGFRSDRRPETAVAMLTWLVIVFLVLLSPDYPWYFLVLVPFTVLTRMVTPWVLTVGAFLLYDVIPNDLLPPFTVRENILYLVTIVAMAFDLCYDRMGRFVGTSGDLQS